MPLRPDQGDKSAGASIAGQSDIAWEERAAWPVAFAVETDPSSAAFISAAATSSQIRCEIFENRAALVDGLSHTTPDLIFLNVTTEGTNAVEVLHALSQCAYPGILQLTSQRGVSMVEPIRQLALLHSLQVLPPLTKPIDETALKSVFMRLGSIVSQTKLPQIRLDDAIKNGWVQFWYQPKINLQDKTLVGMEAFLRLFHPHKGLMSPAAILKNADEKSLTALLRYALAETGAAGAKLAEFGLKVTISINSTLQSLQTLSVSPMFRDYVASPEYQRSWIFDVSEEDIAENQPIIKTLGPLLRSAGVRLAIDNFSGGLLPRSALEQLPISEIKLSPKFVTHCHTKSDHAEVCRALIRLAHDLQSVAVAIGVETSAQSQALQRMGCDVGQGFLYGHPLPLEQLIVMIRQRSVTHRSKTAAGAS